MLKKILSTIGVLVGVLLLLSGVLVLLLSNTAFFGTAVTWVLCGCVAALMLFVIYIGVTRIIDVLGKRQSDEEIIEEQHLKNIFTNEIALKQQTISMTAVNPVAQKTATQIDKTAILNAQKAVENQPADKKEQAKAARASRKMYGKKVELAVPHEVVEDIYKSSTMDAQALNSPEEQNLFAQQKVSVHQQVPVMQEALPQQEVPVAYQEPARQATSANIWDQMEVQQVAEPAAIVYSTSGKLPTTGPTPAQKAAAQRFQSADMQTGATLFDDGEVQNATQNKDSAKASPMPMPTRVTHRQVTRPSLNRQVQRPVSRHTVAEGISQDPSIVITAAKHSGATVNESRVRAEYEGSKENTRVTRRPVSRRADLQPVQPNPEVFENDVSGQVIQEQPVVSQPAVSVASQPTVQEPVVEPFTQGSLVEQSAVVATPKVDAQPKQPFVSEMPESNPEVKITSSLAQEKALALEKTIAEITAAAEGANAAKEETPAEPVKRGRGRPRKIKTPEELAAEAAAAEEPKRKPGRPPKELTPEEIAAMNAPKRPRGRPAKVLTAEEIAAMNAPKRPRGRPRKVETEESVSAEPKE